LGRSEAWRILLFESVILNEGNVCEFDLTENDITAKQNKKYIAKGALDLLMTVN